MTFRPGTNRQRKKSARVVATSNINLTSAPATIDGVTMVAGDRVLCTGQTSAWRNGIWVWDAVSTAMVRATDADIDSEITAGLLVYVEEGTANADTNWKLTTDNPIVVDTTNLTFEKTDVDTAGFVEVAGDTMTGALIVQDTITAEALLDLDGQRLQYGNFDGIHWFWRHSTNSDTNWYNIADVVTTAVTFSGCQMVVDVYWSNNNWGGVVDGEQIRYIISIRGASTGNPGVDVSGPAALSGDMVRVEEVATNTFEVQVRKPENFGFLEVTAHAPTTLNATVTFNDTPPAATGTGTITNPTVGHVEYLPDVDISGDLVVDGGATVAGNNVWHAGNDGTGSGLDADLLDGNEATAFASSSHASSHISGGSDEIDADQAEISWVPSFYTRTTSPAEVSSNLHLTAHLAGIDARLDDVVNPPLYSAYRGGAVNSTSTFADITWDNEVADIKFNTSIGATIGLDEAGEYLIIAQVMFANGSGAEFNGLRILKSGSEIARSFARGSSGNAVQVSAINSFLGSDTIRIQRISDATRAITVGAAYTWVRVVRIRP